MSKILKIIVGIFVGFILVVVVYYIIPKSYIKISIAPDDAQLSIDGSSSRHVTSGQTILVATGKHTYKLSRDQFDTQSVTIESDNNETKELLLALPPLTDTARSILNTNNSQNIIQRIGGKKLESLNTIISQKYPILKDLPIVSHSFTIDSCASQKYPNDPTKIALCVETQDTTAAEMIVPPTLKNKGYNPDDYEIIYSVPPSTDSDFSPENRGED